MFPGDVAEDDDGRPGDPEPLTHQHTPGRTATAEENTMLDRNGTPNHLNMSQGQAPCTQRAA